MLKIVCATSVSVHVFFLLAGRIEQKVSFDTHKNEITLVKFLKDYNTTKMK